MLRWYLQYCRVAAYLGKGMCVAQKYWTGACVERGVLLNSDKKTSTGTAGSSAAENYTLVGLVLVFTGSMSLGLVFA